MKTSNMYYLHLNANTLPHYIVAGCFLPASLIKRRDSDIQDSYPSHLLLSTKRWGENNDCSILIVLTENETSNLIVLNEDYLLFDSFLPLSRIVRVFFNDTEKAGTVLWNIRNGAGFLPENKIEIDESLDAERAGAVVLTEGIINQQLEELSKNLSRFNRFLGGIAFMRVALQNMNDNLINYPVNYIAAVTYFNEYIKKQFDGVKTPKDYKLHTIFAQSAPVRNFLGMDITAEHVESEARKEKLFIDKKFGSLYNFEQIPRSSLTYKLCLLYTYGKNKSKSIDDFLNEFFRENDNETQEEMALIFGIHIGYQDLRNYYKIGNRRVNVKFELESMLDFYIIESIYQFVSNKSIIEEKFNYIDINEEISDVDINYYEGYIQYKIVDKLIITKKKDFSAYHSKILKEVIAEMQELFNKSLVSINTSALLKRLSLRTMQSFTETISAVKEDIANEQMVIAEIKKQKQVTPSKETINIETDTSNHQVEDNPNDSKYRSVEVVKSIDSIFETPDPVKLRELIKKKKRKNDLMEIAASLKIVIPKSVHNSKIENIQDYMLNKIRDL